MVNFATARPVTKFGRKKYLFRKLFEKEWSYCDPDSDPMPAGYWNDHTNVRVAITTNFPLAAFMLRETLSLLRECIVGYWFFAHR